MATETLPVALDLMFGHEGGYTDNSADKGNWLKGKLVGTKYGITGTTLAAHRGVELVSAAQVKALTLKEAEAIYRKSYWSQSGGDLLPKGLDYAAFDFGVNSGPARAVKALQKVVGVAQDGIVGGQTLKAVDRYPGGAQAIIDAYCDERLRFMRSLSTWGKFGKGWSSRVADVRRNAKSMAKRLPPVTAIAEIPTAKASPQDVALSTILKKPEAWGPLAGLISGVGAVASGSGPIQWALAAVIVAGIAYGVYAVVRREKAGA